MNLDQSNAYDFQRNEDGAGLAKVVGDTAWQIGSDGIPANTFGFLEGVIDNNQVNISSVDNKAFRYLAGRQNTPLGPGTTPNRRIEGSGWWIAQNSLIDRIWVKHETADVGSIDTDSDGVVFGSD